MRVKPMSDYVLVKEIECKEKMEGGLYIPDTADDKKEYIIAEVIAVGPGKPEQDEPALPGWKVIIPTSSSLQIKVDDEECILIKGEDILAVIEE